MSNISVVEIVRPIPSTELEQEVSRRQEERQKEIEGLESALEAMSDEEKEGSLTIAELERLQSVNGTQDAAEILAANTIKIAVRSLNRRDAFVRSKLQEQARQWLVDNAGEGDEKYEDIVIAQVAEDIGAVWMSMYQAADIVCALERDQCEGWEIPTDLEGWADLPDYIYTAALRETWSMNPQFQVLALSGNL